jgi:ESF2/ABP1 family protein
LTEKVAYERRVREQKLRVEMLQAKRENSAFISLVEQGKKIDKMVEKNSMKKRNRSSSDKGEGGETNAKRRRHFKQTTRLDDGNTSVKSAILSSLL